MRYDLDAAGKAGVSHEVGYTGWWTGGEDEVSWTHNIVALAQEASVAGGKSYPSGSFIVPLAQPYRAHALTLLDSQKYPDMRQCPDGPPVGPHDNAGWTLPFLMGVTTRTKLMNSSMCALSL
jgi:hypothetical protein